MKISTKIALAIAALAPGLGACQAVAPAAPSSSASAAASGATSDAEWQSMKAQVSALRNAGRFDEAIALSQKVVAFAERTWGPEHLNVAKSLSVLGNTYVLAQDSAHAEAPLLRSLHIREAQPDPLAAGVADLLEVLTQVNVDIGNYPRAESYGRRCLELLQHAGRPMDADLTNTLGALAQALNLEGDYQGALSLAQQSLAIAEKVPDPTGATLPPALNNLAILYKLLGDYQHAVPLYRRALEIEEKAYGTSDPLLEPFVANLANLYAAKGDYAQAEGLYLRALDLTKPLPESNESVEFVLGNLADLYREEGRYAEAAPLFRRSLDLRTRYHGAQTPATAQLLVDMAQMDVDAGDLEAAQPLFLQSLDIRQKILGPDHPQVAASLVALANVSRDLGDYLAAEGLYRRSLAIVEKSAGPMHPLVGTTLVDRAVLEWRRGDLSAARDDLARSADVAEHNLAINLSLGGEADKRSYLSTMKLGSDLLVALQLGPLSSDPDAARQALTTILRRKGRLLGAVSDNVATLRAHLSPEAQGVFDDLARARAHYVHVALAAQQDAASATYRAQLADLDRKLQALEDKMSAQGDAFAVQARHVTVDQVQRALPRDAALVEWTTYRPYDANAASTRPRWGARRYSAYVLRPSGPPVAIDLGDADDIDRLVQRLRHALADPDAPAQAAARDIDQRIMAPVRRQLGAATRLMLSPDGALNLVPFAALVDEHGHYLVERYTIDYLGSGSELLRRPAPAVAGAPSAVIAAPDFDAASATASAASSSASATANARASGPFDPLPGALREAQAIDAILPKPETLLTGSSATKASVQQLHGPTILHVATHGFFFDASHSEGESQPAAQRVALRASRSEAWLDTVGTSENPLLRSGLAFAGANRSADDGILTALEAAGLDLWGTQLVVLSACDTGEGDIAAGDGVYGLRRSLAIAGAQSEVMSLWAADDDSTRTLMVDFYRRLRNGDSRADALRHAQLSLLRSGATRHPFYWANFVLTGDWRPIRWNAGPG